MATVASASTWNCYLQYRSVVARETFMRNVIFVGRAVKAVIRGRELDATIWESELVARGSYWSERRVETEVRGGRDRPRGRASSGAADRPPPRHSASATASVAHQPPPVVRSPAGSPSPRLYVNVNLCKSTSTTHFYITSTDMQEFILAIPVYKFVPLSLSTILQAS